MLWQWIGLAVFSVTLLPAGVALLIGRIPQRLRPRLDPMRPRGLALLAFYAAAPLNAVPRLADASPSITLAATGLAMVVTLAGCIVLIVATQRTRATR
ncbi:hypothetical protein K4749_21560 [Streptomyces sp. TRM72054]|uniref:hypothetical protein n=1 Tax=Streptomyces sp. TRM72054 TaxID=2870562 RepID=UPI001C8B5170|nr:hypothetical protein [Streptomyces sp. TRM72054]MBX9396118.1 hypothetical protein [Streptomyces sp. TRM72054]